MYWGDAQDEERKGVRAGRGRPQTTRRSGACEGTQAREVWAGSSAEHSALTEAAERDGGTPSMEDRCPRHPGGAAGDGHRPLSSAGSLEGPERACPWLRRSRGGSRGGGRHTGARV